MKRTKPTTDRCKIKACAWPAERNGLCIHHWRDDQIGKPKLPLERARQEFERLFKPRRSS